MEKLIGLSVHTSNILEFTYKVLNNLRLLILYIRTGFGIFISIKYS